MNAIERLKELEQKHGSGWVFADNTDDKSMNGEVAFLNAWLGLRREILAVLEAANSDHGHPESWATMRAMRAFNAKAKEIL